MLDTIAVAYWPLPMIYYLVIVVQARDDYGGRMLETMREVRATPPIALSTPAPMYLLARPSPPADSRLIRASIPRRSLFRLSHAAQRGDEPHRHLAWDFRAAAVHGLLQGSGLFGRLLHVQLANDGDPAPPTFPPLFL